MIFFMFSSCAAKSLAFLPKLSVQEHLLIPINACGMVGIPGAAGATGIDGAAGALSAAKFNGVDPSN
jgi:hypothetical protein